MELRPVKRVECIAMDEGCSVLTGPEFARYLLAYMKPKEAADWLLEWNLAVNEVIFAALVLERGSPPSAGGQGP